MVSMSWVDVRERCPVNIKRLVSHAKLFKAFAGIRIGSDNTNRVKKSLIDARAEIDIIFTSLHQVLYDKRILKGRTDEVLYGWFVDNIGRYLRGLDEKEEELLIKYDTIGSTTDRVGVARLSAYCKALKLANSLIYESLLKSIEEYEDINNEDKEEKEPRTFLYILFHVLQITMSSAGGLAREGKSTGVKKGQVSSMPSTWQSFISSDGQQKIADKHKADGGDEITIDQSMIEEKTNEDESDIEDDEGVLFVGDGEEEGA